MCFRRCHGCIRGCFVSERKQNKSTLAVGLWVEKKEGGLLASEEQLLRVALRPLELQNPKLDLFESPNQADGLVQTFRINCKPDIHFHIIHIHVVSVVVIRGAMERRVRAPKTISRNNSRKLMLP
ncbi:hypothetical protein KQX54_019714 [Cotesia glomerata]|uniref:Uncharacterized protein n=1 Tax=Cotesia glomerata TaxID=32391 RepID=A0AAV7IY89_COTGL|nr:hypothetical protein KQX54_019714 [Cotesia glomerata]